MSSALMSSALPCLMMERVNALGHCRCHRTFMAHPRAKLTNAPRLHQRLGVASSATAHHPLYSAGIRATYPSPHAPQSVPKPAHPAFPCPSTHPPSASPRPHLKVLLHCRLILTVPHARSHPHLRRCVLPNPRECPTSHRARDVLCTPYPPTHTPAQCILPVHPHPRPALHSCPRRVHPLCLRQ